MNEETFTDLMERQTDVDLDEGIPGMGVEFG